MAVTVREILVEAIAWWAEGRLHADPGPTLASLTEVQRTIVYNAVAGEVDRGCGQTHLEWVMQSLAHHGDEYLTPDGSAIDGDWPVSAPIIPAALLDVARAVYRQVNPTG